jgi:hypothetical protein
MGRHVRGRQVGHASGAMVGPPPLLGAGTRTADGPWRTTDADLVAADRSPALRSAGPRTVTVPVAPRPRGSGPSAPNPGAATVTLPDGTSFRTQPGRQYTVPVGSRMTLPSRITMRLDRPGPMVNIEDRSRIHVTAPEDAPAA